MKLEIEPFNIGDMHVDEVHVRAMSFPEYAELASKISGDKNAMRAFQRARLKNVVSVTVDGKTEKFTDEQITKIPIKVSKKIIEGMDTVGSGAIGEILSGDADGINAPILYKLGTPIKFNSKSGDQFIRELEFHAEFYGDVEDIIAVDNAIMRTVELIRRVGKPIGIDSMTAMTDAALKQITIMDGLKIGQDILPNFTE